MALMEDVMLRDEAALVDLNQDEGSVWPVLGGQEAREPKQAAAEEARRPFQPQAAAQDVPAFVGGMMAVTYFALIGALALATAGPGQSGLALVIAGFFVAIFFAVPWLIFRQEPAASKRTGMPRFLAQGIQTYTGPCTGKAALVQMFIVPVLLTLGVLLIAAEIALLG